jgi:hypothetical protein
MRRSSHGRLRGLATCLLIGCAVLACSDAMPTETDNQPTPVPFALSEHAVRAFDQALDDVRGRILPALGAVDTPQSLASLLDELTAGIAARDRNLLQRALNRTEAALVQIAGVEGADDGAASIATELDAIRLILVHARPLVNGESEQSMIKR